MHHKKFKYFEWKELIMKLYGLSTRIFSVQLHIHICSKPNDYSNSKNVITFKLQSYQSYGIAHVCYRGHHWTMNPFFATQVHRHTCRPHCRICRSNNLGYRSDCSSRRTCQVDSLSNRISYDLMYKLCHDYETKKPAVCNTYYSRINSSCLKFITS